MPKKKTTYKQYAALVAQSKLTRAQFAAEVGVRPECITRRCAGTEKFREEAAMAAKWIVAGGTEL